MSTQGTVNRPGTVFVDTDKICQIFSPDAMYTFENFDQHSFLNQQIYGTHTSLINILIIIARIVHICYYPGGTTFTICVNMCVREFSEKGAFFKARLRSVQIRDKGIFFA